MVKLVEMIGECNRFEIYTRYGGDLYGIPPVERMTGGHLQMLHDKQAMEMKINRFLYGTDDLWKLGEENGYLRKTKRHQQKKRKTK